MCCMESLRYHLSPTSEIVHRACLILAAMQLAHAPRPSAAQADRAAEGALAAKWQQQELHRSGGRCVVERRGANFVVRLRLLLESKLLKIVFFYL